MPERRIFLFGWSYFTFDFQSELTLGRDDDVSGLSDAITKPVIPSWRSRPKNLAHSQLITLRTRRNP
jgi:hypothetical protein